MPFLTAAIGILVASTGLIHPDVGSAGYQYFALVLLSVGLYGATHSIERHTIAQDRRTTVAAVTVGVLVKALLVAAVAVAATRDIAYLVLGIAIAQIDPLSVSALSRGSRMSPRARTLLSAWASFDDPVTVLLTVYLSSLALSLAHRSAAAGYPGDSGGYFVNLALNLVLIAVGWVLWRLAADRGRRRVLALTLLVGLLAVGAVWNLMLGVAVCGLFFRPARLDGALRWATGVAFFLSGCMLGLLMYGGVELVPGLLLGLAGFAVQTVVSLPLTRAMPRADRVYLALGQQNGITAIILAVLLQPAFPRAVAIIAPAILVINVLNLTTNAGWESLRRHRLVIPTRCPPIPSLSPEPFVANATLKSGMAPSDA